MCGGGCGSVKGEEGSHVISHGAVCESGEGGRNMTRKNRQRGKSTEDEVSTVVVCDDAVCDNFNYNSRGAPVKISKNKFQRNGTTERLCVVHACKRVHAN